MRLSFRSKFIVINLIIVILTMFLVAVLVIQGMLYYNINSAQNKLIQLGNDAALYIQQEIKAVNSSGSNSATFMNYSLILSENLAKQYNFRVQLYSTDSILLADSADIEIDNKDIIRDEITKALGLEKGYAVSVYKKINEVSHIYYAAPIFVENEMVGVVSFIYSLQSMDNLVEQILKLFYISAIVGVSILFIISSNLTKSFLKPIHQLIASTKKISDGDFNEQIHYDINDEIGELTTNFNKMTTNLKQKITQIEDEKQKLTSIISSIGDGVIAIGLNQNILSINNNAKKLLNLMDKKVDIKTLMNLPEGIDMYKEVMLNEKEITRQVQFQEKCYLINAHIIENNNKKIGVLFVIKDITKIIELENQQRQFISSVSHELRTPLTTIIGYTDLLQRRGTDNEELLYKSLHTINIEGRRLLRLVDDLLDLSKYENTEFSMIFTDINLNNLLEEVINQMKIKSIKYNIDILYNSMSFPKVTGDYDRLKQVFINILDNAIKYSNSGDIIKVIGTYDTNFIEISIRDFGQGISNEEIDKVFKAFYRIDKNRTRELGGTGLGLSIVKQIVHKHNGSVDIESKEGYGTMIIVKLPITNPNTQT